MAKERQFVLVATGKGSQLLTVTGEVDEGQELADFRNILHAAQARTTDCLTVDLSQVDFMTGMSYILLEYARRDLAMKGARVVLVNSNHTAHILGKLGYLTRFDQAATMAEGVWYPEMAATA